MKKLALIIILLSAVTASARWRRMPLDEMVRTSPVIVVGKIESIERAPVPKQLIDKREIVRLYDIASIRVERVLKNTLSDRKINPGDAIELSMPSINNPGRRSNDVRFDKGQEGVWMLNYSGNKFHAYRPDSLKPVIQEKQIVEMISLLSGNASKVAQGNNAFALDLYSRLKDDSKYDNIFFSPYSISTALAMTYAGARGETEKQMAKTLRFPLDRQQLHEAFAVLSSNLDAADGDDYKLNIANALWVQQDYKILKQFSDILLSDYQAAPRQVDFIKQTEKARVTINDWVEKKTQDKIKDLIKPGILNSLTRLVLTNAIYFKGDWELKFDKDKTETAVFYPIGNSDKPPMAKMMYISEDFKYTETDNVQVLELPYKGGDLSMVVLLPKAKDGLADLEKSLILDELNGWISKLYKRNVHVYLPKFKLTAEFSLKDTLSAMGMPAAFSNSADFSGINGKKDLFISAVLHKAFVEVNEEGTEAAAATAVVISRTSIPPPPVTFRADHPFVFMIRDIKSGSILFIGRMIDPAKDK